MQLLTQDHATPPGLDTAIARALLLGVSEGRLGETFRVHTPARVVAFGRHDVVTPGYDRAVAAARALNFEAVERIAGGRAAVFHPATIALSWTLPLDDPVQGIKERFDRIAGAIAMALAHLGVDARVGEVAGEYCPGEFSVNARGVTKLAGLGQRLARKAAHVGGVIVVGDSASVRDVLIPVYDALSLGWDPATAGAVEDEIGAVEQSQVVEAVIAALELDDVESSAVDEGTMALARSLAADHLAPSQ